jgi:FtsP/CotA-like multicopper oxidase with cupredoxin domain
VGKQHGHNFYVLATYRSVDGWGSYDPWDTTRPPPGLDDYVPTDTAGPYDLSRAVLRDTVQIPRRGYAVLRFRADNPGVWLFHCHVMWHLAGGMAMVVDAMNGADTEAHQPWIAATDDMRCRV